MQSSGPINSTYGARPIVSGGNESAHAGPGTRLIRSSSSSIGNNANLSSSQDLSSSGRFTAGLTLSSSGGVRESGTPAPRTSSSLYSFAGAGQEQQRDALSNSASFHRAPPPDTSHEPKIITLKGLTPPQNRKI